MYGSRFDRCTINHSDLSHEEILGAFFFLFGFRFRYKYEVIITPNPVKTPLLHASEPRRNIE